jgi:hypothetical protein
VRGILADTTSPRPAFPTHDLERLFGIYPPSLGDEFSASVVRTEDAEGPGRRELEDRFHEDGLVFSREHRFDDGAGDRAGAASRRHFGFVGAGLGDEDAEAGLAVGVGAGEDVERFGLFEVFTAADAGTGLLAFCNLDDGPLFKMRFERSEPGGLGACPHEERR